MVQGSETYIARTKAEPSPSVMHDGSQWEFAADGKWVDSVQDATPVRRPAALPSFLLRELCLAKRLSSLSLLLLLRDCDASRRHRSLLCAQGLSPPLLLLTL